MTIAPEHRGAGRFPAAGAPGSTGGSARAWRGTALLALVLWTLAAVGGCGDGGGTAVNELPLRTDTPWQLESFRPKAARSPSCRIPPSTRSGSGETAGSGSALTAIGAAGTYQAAGAGLTIGPLACTLAACPLPSLGTQFTDALTRVSSYIQTRASCFSSTTAELFASWVPSRARRPLDGPPSPAPWPVARRGGRPPALGSAPVSISSRADRLYSERRRHPGAARAAARGTIGRP